MAGINYNFNFEWLSKNLNNFMAPTTGTEEVVIFNNLLASNLSTRIVNKSFKLTIDDLDVAFFEIEDIVSVDIKGSNLTISLGNHESIILSFINTVQCGLAIVKLETALNGGTI